MCKLLVTFLAFFLVFDSAYAVTSADEFLDKLKDLSILLIPILVFAAIFTYSEWSRRRQ